MERTIDGGVNADETLQPVLVAADALVDDVRFRLVGSVFQPPAEDVAAVVGIGIAETSIDEVDWDEISENRNIRWTIPMIQKFQKKINWDKFSDYADENMLTEGIIEAFKDKWNWHNLSNNGNVPMTDELLEKYADRWDWEQIIDSYGQSVYDRRAIEFYEKFKDYIPVSKLQNTYLWRSIVEQRAKQLAEEITA